MKHKRSKIALPPVIMGMSREWFIIAMTNANRAKDEFVPARNIRFVATNKELYKYEKGKLKRMSNETRLDQVEK